MTERPQFTAKVCFHFREDKPVHRRFIFGNDLHRRAPMFLAGVEGIYTVTMQVESPQTFEPGDCAIVKCEVVVPELVDHLRPGATFDLWDGGYFATGTVIECFHEAAHDA